jgi:hypothetical protein
MVKRSADRRNEYYCSKCKSSPFLENNTIRDSMFQKMQKLVENTVKSFEEKVRSEVQRVEKAVEKNSLDIFELIGRIERAEAEIQDLKKTNIAFTQRLINTDNQLQSCKSRTLPDRNHSLSITIHNIPHEKNENLNEVATKIMTALDVPVEAGHISSCRRVKPSNSTQNSTTKAPMIVMTFISPYYRNLVWKKYISNKSLTVKDVLPQISIDSRVYINLMLSPEKNQIKNETMRFLINPGLAAKFWIHKGTIHVIKSGGQNENPVPLLKLDDVKSLAKSWKATTNGNHEESEA